jgi:hypothetical protein
MSYLGCYIKKCRLPSPFVTRNESRETFLRVVKHGLSVIVVRVGMHILLVADLANNSRLAGRDSSALIEASLEISRPAIRVPVWMATL